LPNIEPTVLHKFKSFFIDLLQKLYSDNNTESSNCGVSMTTFWCKHCTL